MKSIDEKAITPEEFAANEKYVLAAREWIDECQWADLEEEAESLTVAEVVLGIAQHYSGGLSAFVRDAEPERN